MPDRIEQVQCGDIEVADRYRHEMGDLQSLADSIAAVGLLHPIGITLDRRLIFGERRLRAVRDILHWENVAARVFDLDADLTRQAELDENEVRKSLTLSERYALLQALRLHRPERRGRPKKPAPEQPENSRQLGGILSDKESNNLDRHLAESSHEEAHIAGFSSEQEAERVGEVIEHGVPDLVQAMEDEEVSVAAAVVISTEPPEEQSRIVSLDGGRRKHEVKRLRQQQAERRRKPVSPLTQGEQIYLLMEAIENLGSTQLDCENVAHEYSTYKRAGTFERIRLAIVFLQKLERAYPKYEEAAQQGAK
jgi:hypothetical protein